MRKFIASLTVVLTLAGGASLVTAETAQGKPRDYRARIIAGTYLYGPCKSMRQTSAGRVAYWDAVADNTDDGRRRPAGAQITYVRQSCRNGA
jgi:hypothetical protein